MSVTLLTGSCSPGDRLQHYKTGAPSRAATHSSFLWWSEQSFGSSPCPSPLERLVLGLVIRYFFLCVSSNLLKACVSPLAERCSSWVCGHPISVLCGVALLLFAALNACCVLTAVCFVLWTYPMSALHREMWGEQNVLCLPVIVEPSPMP
jgi:hypothetical protein